MTDNLRDMQGQWTEEKVWRTGGGWAGAALWQGTQGRGKHRRRLQQQTRWVPCAPVGERESRCTLYQDERRDEVIRKTRVPKLSKM